jgi:hypothetical protein
MGETSHSAMQHDDPWADAGDVDTTLDRSRETQEWNKMSEQFFNVSPIHPSGFGN